MARAKRCDALVWYGMFFFFGGGMDPLPGQHGDALVPCLDGVVDPLHGNSVAQSS